MDVDTVVYNIVKKVALYAGIKSNGESWFTIEESEADPIAPLFKKEFNNNYRLLRDAIIKINRENIITGLIVTDYPNSEEIVGLDIRNAVLSSYAYELANTHPLKIKLSSSFGKLKNSFDAHKKKVQERTAYYEKYTDKQLIEMVRRNSFPSVQDRIAIMNVLKKRGYAKTQ